MFVSSNKVFRFTKAPKGYWKEQSNRVQFIESLKNALNLQDKSDWSNYVTVEDIIEQGGAGMLKYYHGLNNLLHSFNSSHQQGQRRWRDIRPDERKAQISLHRVVQSVFEGLETISNYQMRIIGQRCFELDVFIPSLNLYF
jgi:hypothetical protein